MFYVDRVLHGRAEITGDTARHLRKVLRVEEGFRYEISDNEQLYLAEVTGFGKDLVAFQVIESLAAPQPVVRLHLAPALIKFDAFEWMLEKATELGVERITPVYAARSDKGLDQAALKRRERWERILLESGQQSRRVRRPSMSDPVRLPAALALDGSVRLWLEEQPGRAPLLAALPDQRDSSDTVVILVGPEGGWEESEREHAITAQWRPVSLGPQVLRAETAAISALAVVNAAWQTR